MCTCRGVRFRGPSWSYTAQVPGKPTPWAPASGRRKAAQRRASSQRPVLAVVRGQVGDDAKGRRRKGGTKPARLLRFGATGIIFSWS